jgi:ABC-2 type transport system ATP-binding protein
MGNNAVVEASSISKAFDGTHALDSVSFSASGGEILGLLGPNGAGKTTAIRILLNILTPDSGTVSIFGDAFSEKSKDLVGYLPEERGLYRNEPVLETLVYLASLKGMDDGKATEKAKALLAEFGLSAYERSKINELSKGMQQKVQFISTILHEPKLVVFDEPFSGLDPINTQLVKDVIIRLKDQGAAVILSTHMLDEAERMCDRVLLINKGKTVLYDTLKAAKSRFGKNYLKISYSGALPKTIKGAADVKNHGNYAEIRLENGASANDILEQLVGKVDIAKFELAEPSLNEIFMEVVTHG